MLKITSTTLALGTVLFCGRPLLADDVSASGPIVITSVRESTNSPTDYNYGPGFLTINFTNVGERPAAEVVFHLTDGAGNESTIHDVGVFSRGVPIRHSFELTGFHDAKVRVDEVRFEDGTTFRRSV
jgi:hypothetical protein